LADPEALSEGSGLHRAALTLTVSFGFRGADSARAPSAVADLCARTGLGSGVVGAVEQAAPAATSARIPKHPMSLFIVTPVSNRAPDHPRLEDEYTREASPDEVASSV